MADIQSYKCPNCGGPLEFGIEGQNWECKFCRSQYNIDQLVGQDEKTGEPTSGSLGSEEEVFGAGTQEYSCPNCGAHVIADNDTVATFCVFCKGPVVLESRLTRNRKPARIVPFKVTKEAAVEAYRGHLRKKPLIPKPFRSEELISEITGLYVPFWLYSCNATGRLSGQADKVTTWSDSNYRYTKTDTYNVEREGGLDFESIPADGSVRLEDMLMSAIEPFDYSGLTGFQMQYLSGHLAEGYNVDEQQALAPARKRIASGLEGQMRGTINGYSSVRVSFSGFETNALRWEYVMMPVWLLTTKYKEKLYRFAVNGQTGKPAGDLPVSGGRAALFSLLFFAGGALITLLIQLMLGVGL